MNPALRLLLLVLALPLSGCFTRSVNPLSDPAKAVADAKLDGVWTAKTEDDRVHLFFAKKKDSQLMEVAYVARADRGGIDVSRFTMFPTTVGEMRIMNLQTTDDSKYILARYEFSDQGALTVWLLDEGAAAAAVEGGRIKGEVKRDQVSRDVLLTDSTENLARFFGGEGKTLLKQKFATFQKAKE